MPVNWVRVEMPLGGVDALSDPVHVLPGKLLTLQNGRFDQPGGVSKRRGYSVRSGAIFSDSVSLLSTGVRLAEMADGEQLLFDARNVYAWETHAGVQQWVDRGRPGDVVISAEHINFDQASNLAHVDLAMAPNGMRLVCWLPAQSTAIAPNAQPVFNYFVSVGSTVLVKGSQDSPLLPTAFDAVLIEPFVIDNEIWALSPSSFGAGHDIRWAFIDSTDDDPTELTFAPASFTAPALGSNAWDLTKACVGSVASRFAVLFSSTADANDLHISYRNSTTQAQVWDYDSNIDGSEIFCDALFASDSRVWFAYGQGNELRMHVVNETTGAPITGDTLIDSGGSDVTRIAITRFSSSAVLVCWEQRKGDAAASPPSARLPFVRWAIVGTALTVTGSIHILSDVAMIGKPFLNGGLFYLPVMHTGKGYGNGFLIQIGDAAQTSDAQGPSWRATYARDVCTADGLDNENDALQIDGLGVVPGRGHVPNGSTFGAFGTRFFPIRTAEKFEVARDDDSTMIIRHCGVRVIEATLQASARNWSRWGAGMFIASGRPSWYDGVQLGEHGFAWQPSVDRDTVSDLFFDPGGIFPVDMVVQAQSIWQFQDANGQIQQSEPSAIMEATNGAANQELFVRLRNTLLTDRAATDVAYWSTGISRPRTATYRTLDGPGPVFYRAQQFYAGDVVPPNETTTETVGPSTNIEMGSSGITQESDAAIQDNDVLYTTGGILPNTGTPPAEVCHVHDGRLWLALLEDLHEVWFSQPFVATEAPRFSGFLKLRFDTEIFSLGTLDDKLIAGGVRTLYVVTGKGPPATGDIDIGFQIERIASDVGCIDHRSMVQTPMGLMFYAAGRGFMLLDRSLQLQEIGAPIKQILTDISARLPTIATLQPAFFPIRCGTLVPDQTQVRWLSNVTDLDDDNHAFWFVYDYRVGEWSWDITSNAGVALGVDAITFFGGARYAYLTDSGQVFDEDLTVSEDAGNFIEFALETPWIRLDTLQGWQRVRSVTILGKKPADPAFIVVGIGYDYEDDYSQFVVISQNQIDALPTDVLQFKIRFDRQKCESFRLLISDGFGEDGGSNDGLRFSSLVFECGLKKGTMKLRQEQKL